MDKTKMGKVPQEVNLFCIFKATPSPLVKKGTTYTGVLKMKYNSFENITDTTAKIRFSLN